MLLLPNIGAHEDEAVDPGITPDSILWGLDKAFDNLNLLLTFNSAEKARKGIEIARERLEEIKAMAEENKIEAAEDGKEEQLKVLAKVKQSISNIKEKNSTKQIEEEIEIEKELEEHEDEVKELGSNLKIKIEVKGSLSEHQKAVLNFILSSLENETNEVKAEIRNKKDRTKIEIKQKTGKSEKEIEEEIEDIEEEKGLTDIKKEKSMEKIEDAKEDLMELEEELAEHKAEGHIADEKPIIELIGNAHKRIANAEEAFSKNDFGEAFGQANSAEQLIKNAERVLEKTVEKFEEEEHEMEEREIEVEIEGGKAKIEININDEKLEFAMQTTDKGAIIREIAARTGLSVEEAAKLADFGGEKEDKSERSKGTDNHKAEED